MTSSEAYLTLNLLPGIGPVRVRQLVEAFGSPEAILERSAAQLAQVHGIGAKLAETVAGWRALADPAAEQRLAERAGVQLLTPDLPAYPELLREIHDPPLCLYVSGRVEALAEAARRGLAVVGTRHTTLYGEGMAKRLTASAVKVGWVVVSGLARGVDTVAHRTALDAGGVTIGVMACGLASVYPPENADLAREMLVRGAVVSEVPMLMKPDRRSFPMRNRIISGLTLGTLVVEAGCNSGALITAQLALDQGRQVFAVPGRVDAPQSRGCHALIRQGAKLVETLDDVMAEFSFLPGFSAPAGATGAPPAGDLLPGLALDLTETEQQIVGLLQQGELSLDELVTQVGEPVQSLLTVLLTLELRHLVEQLPGRRFALKQRP